MKIVTVVGARPQFIKAATVSRVIRDGYTGKIEEVLVHTGQHYDENMSKVFFEELDIPQPKYNLEISGGQHGAMTGRMLEAVESVLLQEKPDSLLIYGDTNSTLAGALAAAKLHIPVAHVEAGLRSFNMRMPEEINRILSDRISTQLFCPTETAVKNLAAEGVTEGVHNVGDVMYDGMLYYRGRAQTNVLNSIGANPGRYVMATVHRAENTDDPVRLRKIFHTLGEAGRRFDSVVIALHPRTKKILAESGIVLPGSIKVIDPAPYLEMIALVENAAVVMTDSGGLQKEAFFLHKPCLTLRDETEWSETLECGANKLVGSGGMEAIDLLDQLITGQWKPNFSMMPYGAGKSANEIINFMVNHA